MLQSSIRGWRFLSAMEVNMDDGVSRIYMFKENLVRYVDSSNVDEDTIG